MKGSVWFIVLVEQQYGYDCIVLVGLLEDIEENNCAHLNISI